MNAITNDSNYAKLRSIMGDVVRFVRTAQANMEEPNPEQRIDLIVDFLDRAQSRARNAVELFNYIRTNPIPMKDNEHTN